jgi:hypothetical protein
MLLRSANDADICPKADLDPVAGLENQWRVHSQLLVDLDALLHKVPADREIVAFLDGSEGSSQKAVDQFLRYIEKIFILICTDYQICI